MTAAPEHTGDVPPLEIVCAAAGMRLVVPPDCSILETVRRAGLDVPAACADRRCGACETRAFGGVPEHRDAVLTGEERAVGETMMICVSRASTPWLVLDL